MALCLLFVFFSLEWKQIFKFVCSCLVGRSEGMTVDIYENRHKVGFIPHKVE
ncbi:MAG: hypothetical protein K0R57_1073 [Paenibacillaceae bacterium]|nr:hypothetical protein [Paenibacillaceae bacterium]